MKRIIPVIVFLCCINFFPARGQDYIPLFNPEATWDIGAVAMGGFCLGDNPVRYKIQGDTMFNSTVYHTVYQFYSTNNYTIPYCPPFYVDTVPHLTDIYVREDIEEHKVYRYDPQYNMEYLLFDFNLSEGDEMGWLTIDTVYYITTADGLTRKVLDFWYDGSNEFAAIEGIGGPFGPFEEPKPWFENYHFPMCYKVNGVNIFYSQCSDLYTVDRTDLEPPILKCYPNPVTDHLYIEASANTGLSYLTIINSMGKQVMEVSGSGILKIDFTNLTGGIYYIKLKSGTTNYSQVVVKIQ